MVGIDFEAHPTTEESAMASLTRYQTDKVGVFYILSRQKAKNKLAAGDNGSSEKPNKIYYIMYRLDGKKVEEKVGRESERMTPAKAAKIREQRIHGVTLPNTERRRIRKEKARAEADCWTIGKLWGAYKENKPDFKGLVTDENRFQNYLHDFAKLTPEEVTTQMVDSLRLRLTKSGKKAGTVKNVLELLRRIINFGVRKGHCAWQDPSRLHFEMPRLNNTKTEMLTQEERKRLIEAAKAAPNRKAGQLMLMAYYTGMRRSELFRLKWGHIDFENGFINIVGENQEGAKSNRDERIPLSPPVRELLQDVESGDSPYVFPGKDGVSRLTDINKQVNAIKKEAGLPKDFRPLHGLRHTFASVAVSNGVPLSHVQKLLTHKDPTLTQRYAHLEDEALKRAAAAVSGFLGSAGDNGSET
jgi:integrase